MGGVLMTSYVSTLPTWGIIIVSTMIVCLIIAVICKFCETKEDNPTHAE